MIRFFNFYPIPFLFCLLILAIILWLNRSRGWLTLLGLVVLGGYLMLVIDVMYFPLPFPKDWPANLTRAGIKESLLDFNPIPFHYYARTGLRARMLWGMRDIVLNVLLTIPIGLGVGALFKPRWWAVPFLAVGTGLAFEGAQLFFKVFLGVFFHSVDITDVITNAAGFLAGVALAWMASWALGLMRKTLLRA